MQGILFETDLIEALQNALSPTFDWLFVFFTELGGDFAYLAFIGIAYWCLSKKGAVIVFYILLLSRVFEPFAKDDDNDGKAASRLSYNREGVDNLGISKWACPKRSDILELGMV